MHVCACVQLLQNFLCMFLLPSALAEATYLCSFLAVYVCMYVCMFMPVTFRNVKLRNVAVMLGNVSLLCLGVYIHGLESGLALERP